MVCARVRWRAPWLALALALAVPPGAARAAGKAKPALGVLGLKGDAVSPAALAKANDSVVAKFKAGGEYKVVKGTDIGAMMMLMGCAAPTPDCLTLIGTSMKVSKLVHGTIEPAGSAYKVTLVLFDLSTGAVERTRSETVTESDLGAKMGDLVKGLTSKGTNGVLRVSSSVPGAGVMIDGGAAGSTPISLSIRAGKHSVLVSAPGHRPYSADVDVAIDATIEVAAVLEPLKADVPPPDIVPPPPPKKDKDPDVAPPPLGDGRIGGGGAGTGTGAGTGGTGGALAGGGGSGGAGGAGGGGGGGGGGSVLRVPGYIGVVGGIAGAGVAAYFGVSWLIHRGKFVDVMTTSYGSRDTNGNWEIDGFSDPGVRDLCDNREISGIPTRDIYRMELGGTAPSTLEEAWKECDKAKSAMIIGWVAAGAGVVLLGTGVALVVAGGGNGGSGSSGSGSSGSGGGADGGAASRMTSGTAAGADAGTARTGATPPVTLRVLPELSPAYAGGTLLLTF
ncbi:MAG TPA: PEGA domain-containing protein [Myxococcota bacterium]|nr:PEGA domain-containing protein [Myxococcota bacterium]